MGCEVIDEEFVVEFGILIDKINDLLEYSCDLVSLDMLVGFEEEVFLGDFIEDVEVMFVENVVIVELLYIDICSVLVIFDECEY